MIKNRIIIIGGSHHNTLGLIRSVGEKGYPVTLFLEPCSLDFCFLQYSKYITNIHCLKNTEEALYLLLHDYCSDPIKPILICGSDFSVSLLDNHFDELKEKFEFFNAGSQGRINYFLDKENMLRLAEECGFDTIKTWHIQNVHNIPEDIIYPCLSKPQNSLTGSKEDIQIYRSKAELLQSLDPNVDYLVQEYIEKDYELNTVCLAYNQGKNIVAPATIQKIRDSIRRQSAYMKICSIENYEGFPLVQIERLVSTIGYEGIFSVELLFKGGKYYFLEINMRNDGCGYLYTAAGANYSDLWIKYASKTENISSTPIECKLPLTFMQEADFLNVIDGNVGLLTWLKQFVTTDVFFVLNRKDMKPFLFTMYVHARQLFRKILKKH